MSLQDLISDFVARIKNTVISGNNETKVLKNKLVTEVCKKLVTLNYLEKYEDGDRELTVKVKPGVIKNIVRASKPGQRQYTGYADFPRIENGLGFYIVTTSQGVKTHVECKKEKIGGEVLFKIIS